jgi:Ankyrin repeats (3 copies)
MYKLFRLSTMLPMKNKTPLHALLLLLVAILGCTGCINNPKISDPRPSNNEAANATTVEDPLPDDLINGVQNTVLKGFLSKFKKGQLGIDNPIDVSGCWPNQTQDYTGLQIAALAGELEVLKCLLKAGADPNAKTKSGETALYLVACSGKVEAVKVLIDTKGVDINLQDGSDLTPLHAAMMSNAAGHECKQEIVRLLAQHKGIDFTKTDWRGWTPLKLAQQRDWLGGGLVDILKENGAQS